MAAPAMVAVESTGMALSALRNEKAVMVFADEGAGREAVAAAAAATGVTVRAAQAAPR